jgi:hypothetical protein
MLLSPIDFGQQLLTTGDLDPVYIVVWNADLEHKQLKRWLLAYWCYYNCGTSCWIADAPTQDQYWQRMADAAASKEYPRGHERRHFRGELSKRSVAWLFSVGVDRLFDQLCSEPTTTSKETIQRVKTWYGFGDWIAFKVADMLERLGLVKVKFDYESLKLFDSPQEGAERMVDWYLANGLKPHGWQPEGRLTTWAVQTIVEAFKRYPAPPDGDRFFNIQEAETVLCKWKSYLNGHYKIGEDIDAVRESLKFRPCETSQRFVESFRKSFI